jgi:rod shape determining protein RodA
MIMKKSFRRYFSEIDKGLLATIVAVSLFGLLNIYGVAGLSSQFFQRHVIYLFIGFGLMTFISLFDYRYFKNNSVPALTAYIFSIILLLLTLVSTSVRGTNAWITFAGLTFEPSEVAKLALIILMAKYFSQRHIQINEFKHVLISGIYFFIPTGIILNQPDLGSAIILSLVWLGMLLAAGINRRHFFLLIILALGVSFLGWVYFLEPYQKTRLISFVNPQSDPLGSGYNIIQSQIAIGSGHWFGNGLGKGYQAKLGFLPEPYHDFAFAAAIEQFGFVGIIVFLSGMMMIIYKMLDIGSRANNNFGRLFSIGMVIFIFSHVIISASVNNGLMPVTGLPFPLLSYGGSHLISIMIGMGIIQSIKRYG